MDIFRFILDNAKRSISSQTSKLYNFLLRKEPIQVSSIAEIAEYLKNSKNVIVMTGAGISTNANIPDFRSESFGLYRRIEKYNLPHPTAVFTLDYFIQNPKPFYEIAHEMYPVVESAKPTIAHYFIKLLNDKNVLMRHYTQNIDGLEDLTGLPYDKTVQAHGNVKTGTCLKCGNSVSMDYMREFVIKNEIPMCNKCSGVIKPDVVLFGEGLPKSFWKSSSDFPKCDLLIIMGTSLVVQPFASLAGKVNASTPRLLINKDSVGNANMFGSVVTSFLGLDPDFDSNKKDMDVFYQGDCDEGCMELCRLLGWDQELKNLVETGNEKISMQRQVS